MTLALVPATGRIPVPHLDTRHVETLHHNLDELADLYHRLPDALTGIRRAGGAIRLPPCSKPPLSVGVVDALDRRLKDARDWLTGDPRNRDLDRWGIIPRLGLWVKLIDNEMAAAGEHILTLDDWDWQNPDALCRAVRVTTPWLIEQDWAGILARDVAAMVELLRQLLGVPAEFKPRCANVWCGTLLVEQDGGAWWLCPHCERHYVVAEDLQRVSDAQWLLEADVAQLLDLGTSTVRWYKSEGWIRPAGFTASGVALWDLDQVRVVRDTPASERRRLG